MVTFLFFFSQILLTIGLFYSFYRIQKKVGAIPWYIVLTLLLLAAVYGLGEIFLSLDFWLMHKQIYIESGHASLLNVIILFLSLVGTFVLALLLGIKKMEK
ncbi:MAG: hypothetical protein K0R65_859 [Crocinitomicaceae bacterium]|jgi:hypothetical protein|nr:hypothetical protein [Crocinitomicaceae bacterium]